MQDIELKCRDCGETFTFTAGEQESRSFISRKALQINPQDVPNAAKPEKLKETISIQTVIEKKRPFRDAFKITFIPRLR